MPSLDKDGGHGHVYPRADGSRARCGGPTSVLGCISCRADAAQKAKEETAVDGDLPIGDLKMNGGSGINNYTQPSIPVQGAIARLLSTQD
jgi:hypothetical protein